MTSDDLKIRLKKIALRIIELADSLPNTISGQATAKQIVRSGTSPGTNYRCACLGKSDKDFINKLKMVEEELDETLYWLELIGEGKIVKQELISDLMKENNELFRIIVSSIKTMKNKINSK